MCSKIRRFRSFLQLTGDQLAHAQLYENRLTKTTRDVLSEAVIHRTNAKSQYRGLHNDFGRQQHGHIVLAIIGIGVCEYSSIC